jgi:predicted nuclease of predicted toxin-antitoxin system
MLRLASDEDFDNDILRGLIRQRPELDIVRVQDIGLASKHDTLLLEWAAQESRIILTHDRQTMTKYAYERLRSGQPMPGILVVRQSLPIGGIIENILLLLEASLVGEWEGQVRYVPL